MHPLTHIRIHVHTHIRKTEVRVCAHVHPADECKIFDEFMENL